MTESLTCDELEMLFDKGEDPDDIYDWDNAMIAPPVFSGDGDELPVVIHLSRSLLGKIDPMAESCGQTVGAYLSDAVGRMFSTL